MPVWMNRAGRRGESESAFLGNNRIYLQWKELDNDLSKVESKEELREILCQTYPDAPAGRISSYLGQIWTFAKLMKPGDWVGLPSKLKRVIHFGEITSDYIYDSKQDPLFRQYRSVKWFAPDIPRSSIPQEILYMFGAQTICKIDAESSLKVIASAGWNSIDSQINNSSYAASDGQAGEKQVERLIDVEESARDEIAKLIGRRFKGHDLAWLVEKILQAQGYTTHLSPEGPDYGIDIVAAPGALGFGQPRIVVQVKSGESQVDRPTVDQLIGTMQNTHADHGLFVSWSGFKSSVDREKARQFFRVRLWDQKELIEQILNTYDKLDEEVRAEIPLKRIWTVAHVDELSTEE